MKLDKSFLTTTGRIFSGGLRGFLRNSWLSSAAILVMTATLSVGLLTLISFVAYGKQTQKLADRVDIKVFLKDSSPEKDVKAYEAYIRSISGVRDVIYTSKEQALEDYKKQKAGNPDELKALEFAGAENILPASFTVKVYSLDDLDRIQNKLKNEQFDSLTESSERNDQKTRGDKNIANWLKKARQIGLLASILLGTISALIITNTIRLAIFNRKDEIEIMRLIGASKIYIKGPFLVEAAIYGMVAGVITYVIMRLTILSLNSKSWAGDLAETISVFTNNDLIVGILIVCSGALLGILAAQLAIRKYVKFKSY